MIRSQSEFLALYLDRGLFDIIVIDYEHKEERSGYQVEHTDETIVAKHGSKFVRVSVSDIFHPMKHHEEPSVGMMIVIDESTYARYASDNPIIDTLKARAELPAQKMVEQTKQEASDRLKQIAPACPRCGSRMAVRYNGKNGKPFWGCSTYPNCKGTQNFTIAHKRLHAVASGTT